MKRLITEGGEERRQMTKEQKQMQNASFGRNLSVSINTERAFFLPRRNKNGGG